ARRYPRDGEPRSASRLPRVRAHQHYDGGGLPPAEGVGLPGPPGSAAARARHRRAPHHDVQRRLPGAGGRRLPRGVARSVGPGGRRGRRAARPRGARRGRSARRRRGGGGAGRGGGGGPDAIAAGIVAVAAATMARALKRVSVARGFDPRQLALLPYGGAGPLFGCALADALGMRTIVLPPHPGVLSALGLAAAAERIEVMASFHRALPALTTRELAAAFAPLVERAREERAPRARRTATVGGARVEASVWPLGELAAGVELEGPAILAGGDATALVEPGWRGRVHRSGAILLERR